MLESPRSGRGGSQPPLNTSASFSRCSPSASPARGRVAAETRSIDWTAAQRGVGGGGGKRASSVAFHQIRAWFEGGVAGGGGRREGKDIYTLRRKNNTEEDVTPEVSRVQSQRRPVRGNTGCGFLLQL